MTTHVTSPRLVDRAQVLKMYEDVFSGELGTFSGQAHLHVLESATPTKTPLRPAGSDPEVVCQKNSFLKVSGSLGGFGPSVAHGKHSVRRRCVEATKNKAETCSLLDAVGRRSCGR